MTHLKSILFASLFTAAVACGSSDSTGTDSSGTDSSGTDSSGTDSSGTDSSGTDSSGNAADACRKLDIIFSVDPSSSMREEHEIMATEIFPAFARELLNVGDGLDDYRVAVIDSCPLDNRFRTAGIDDNNGDAVTECNFEGGERFMTSNSADLEREFTCVGDFDEDPQACAAISSQDEQPLRAAISAIEDPQNSSFLRDDALLVVFALTDEDECPGGEDPINGCPGGQAIQDDLYNDLVALKGGNPQRMVVVGMGATEPCTGGSIGDAGVAADDMLAVTQQFADLDRGVILDICSQAPIERAVEEAIAIIDQACREFTPIE